MLSFVFEVFSVHLINRFMFVYMYSAFALSLILQYGLKNNDQRLQTIHVRGDQIFSHTDGVKTRSKALQSMCIVFYFSFIPL